MCKSTYMHTEYFFNMPNLSVQYMQECLPKITVVRLKL